jgi:ATP-dependent DNA helicase PIF1
MELSPEQKIAFDKYKNGKNVFITGPGGSGKSALIKTIYQDAKVMKKNIQVCALTGCAALLLGCKAKTVHSWSGIGLGNGQPEHLIAKIKSNKYSKSTWTKTDILIIDEVSMLSLKLFNVLNKIGQSVRQYPRPFGGIQVIFSGDFYQLPPVGNSGEPDTSRFCFESEDWKSVFEKDCQIQLITIFRQSGDPVYSNILNEIRIGKMKRKSVDILQKQVNRVVDDKLVVEPTKLFPTKNKVEVINTTKMNELEGEERVYSARNEMGILGSSSEIDSAHKSSYAPTPEAINAEFTYLNSNLICEKELKLKKGSHVMCIVNILKEERSILVCNGSQGIVTDFCTITGNPKVKFNNGSEMVMGRHLWPSEKIPAIGVSQIPLILAWAITIHKSQGATMDTAEVDVGSGVFECGQTYVALSRVKSLEGLYLTSFDVNKIKINKKVQDFYKELSESQEVVQKVQESIQEKDGETEKPENPFSEFAYKK